MAYKKEHADLKSKYKKVLELGLLISFLIHTVIFLSFKKFEKEEKKIEEPEITINVEDIPKTTQMKRSEAPSRPAIPVESDDPELAEDVTIEDTDIDLMSEVPPAPPPPKIEEKEEEEIPPFLPIEDQPELIGGMESIREKLKYPEIARKAQVEGVVIVRVLVGKTGKPEEVEVLKSSGNESLDQAAVKAVWEGARYKPAKQRGKPVKFRMIHRIIFSLENQK